MVKCSKSDSQSSSGDVVHVFMSSFSETADAEITTSVTRASICVVNETARYREQTAPCAFESLSRMSNTDQSAPRRL